MKSKVLEKQLRACEFADLTNYDPETKSYYIKKYSKPLYDLQACYLVKINADTLLNRTSVVAVNWNKGQVPICEYMTIFVLQIIGKMINVDGIGYDINTKENLPMLRWSGWLHIDEITQLEKL